MSDLECMIHILTVSGVNFVLKSHFDEIVLRMISRRGDKIEICFSQDGEAKYEVT